MKKVQALSQGDNDMQIKCPFCGWREIEEFNCRTAVIEARGGAIENLYTRVNHPVLTTEYWQHLGGCRTWFLCCRNPSTDEVLDISYLKAGLPSGEDNDN